MPKSSKKTKVKKGVVKAKLSRNGYKFDFDFFKWLSLGFSIASVGIGIAILLYIVTSLNK